MWEDQRVKIPTSFVWTLVYYSARPRFLPSRKLIPLVSSVKTPSLSRQLYILYSSLRYFSRYTFRKIRLSYSLRLLEILVPRSLQFHIFIWSSTFLSGLCLLYLKRPYTSLQIYSTIPVTVRSSNFYNRLNLYVIFIRLNDTPLTSHLRSHLRDSGWYFPKCNRGNSLEPLEMTPTVST